MRKSRFTATRMVSRRQQASAGLFIKGIYRQAGYQQCRQSQMGKQYTSESVNTDGMDAMARYHLASAQPVVKTVG